MLRLITVMAIGLALISGPAAGQSANMMAAARAGNAEEMTNLGVVYQYGMGVAVNDAEAVRWYLAAAAKGNARAMNLLGVMYENGRGVPRNAAIALNYYRGAAAAGDLDGRANLARLSASYTPPPAARPAPAQAPSLFDSWLAAARAGRPEAMVWIGDAYKYGQRGVAPNAAEATRWYQAAVGAYRSAAARGDATAMYGLAGLYRNGRGVPQNFAEEVRWLRAAAEKGDADAQFSLGNKYEYGGGGVSRDTTMALAYYRRAAAAGNAYGRDGVRRLTGQSLDLRPPRRDPSLTPEGYQKCGFFPGQYIRLDGICR